MPLGSEGGTLAILYTQQHLCCALEKDRQEHWYSMTSRQHTFGQLN
ncbi:MAG: hypothetical protein ACTS85_02340 [Arsenophonus sp. NC-PG7-MAG3]